MGAKRGVTLEEVEARITRAHKTRPPRWGADDRHDEKVETLADYLLSSAHARADLEEARSWLGEALQRFEEQWDDVDPGPCRTEKERQRQIALALPEVAAGRADAKRYLQTIERLVRRFERDEQTTSRIYTLMTGNA